MAEYSPDTEDVFEDVLQTGRLEIDYLWRSWEGGGEGRHRLVAHGADIAQLLGQNHIGLEPPKQLFVHRVERASLDKTPADPVVNLGARKSAPVDLTPCYARLVVCLFGVIALV